MRARKLSEAGIERFQSFLDSFGSESAEQFDAGVVLAVSDSDSRIP